MKVVYWENKDLDEPLCFDSEENIIDYDAEKIGKGDVMIDVEGYGYYISPGAKYPNKEHCLEGQNFDDYVDENHQPENY